ncbi:MAG: GNAT family N-acetyltransferase [Chlamydiales bacterium]
MIQFNGKKVFLRKAEEADIGSILPWIKTNGSSLDIFPGLSNDVIQMIQRSDENNGHAFLIENTSSVVIGYIFTYFCDRKNGTFSYYVFINSSHRCQGAAKESIMILLRFYFQELRFQKVTIPISVFNKSASTLHDILGFKLEGRLRRMIYSHGQFFDLLTYGITGEEFENMSINIEEACEKAIFDN